MNMWLMGRVTTEMVYDSGRFKDWQQALVKIRIYKQDRRAEQALILQPTAG